MQCSEMSDMTLNPLNTSYKTAEHAVLGGVKLGQEPDPQHLNTSYNTVQHTRFDPKLVIRPF